MKELTNLYSLQKTLRFELKPVPVAGETPEQAHKRLTRAPFFNADAERERSYEDAKTLIDDCLRDFIEEKLAGARLDWKPLADAIDAHKEHLAMVESLDNGKHRDDGRQRPENPQQRHNCDPKPAHLVDLFIDYRMMGLGGDDSWGAKPHKIYQIDPAVGKISYGFALVPLDKNASIDKAIKQY